MNVATALGLLILFTWVSAQAQVSSLPAPPVWLRDGPGVEHHPGGGYEHQ